MRTLEQELNSQSSRSFVNSFNKNTDRVLTVANRTNTFTRLKNDVLSEEFDVIPQNNNYSVSNYSHTVNDSVYGQDEVSSFGKGFLEFLNETQVLEKSTYYSNPDNRGVIKLSKYTQGNVAGQVLEKLDSSSQVLVNSTNEHNAAQFGVMAEQTGADVSTLQTQIHAKTYLARMKDGSRVLNIAGGNLSRSVFLDKGNLATGQMAQINLGVLTTDQESIREYEAIYEAVENQSLIPDTKNFIVSGPGAQSHYKFRDLLKTAKSNALIVSPFIDSRILGKTIQNMESNNVDVTIVTNPLVSTFKKGSGGHFSGRLKMLAKAKRAGAKIYTTDYDDSINYHLKGIAVDTGVAAIGSDNFTNKTHEGRSIEVSKIGLYADELYKVFNDGVSTKRLKEVGEGNDPSDILLMEMVKGLGLNEQGVTNADYVFSLSSSRSYLTIGASLGTSKHYQRSLYKNMMRQGGYSNLAQDSPFEGVATSLVKTNIKLLNGINSKDEIQYGAGTLFVAQQFDKGLYTSGLGEYLNNNLFIPTGFGRAYKDEKGFLGSVAGLAGRMLDESYLYYANINPDVQLIGNEYEQGIGMGNLEARRTGLFESTFTRAAEYTVAAAQSLGMYIAITQPIEMLKASVYKNTLDATLTNVTKQNRVSAAELGSKRTAKLGDFIQKATSTFYFGDLDTSEDILEKMFEVDRANEQTIKIDGKDVQRKQTAFFEHNTSSGSLFQSQQFLSRGRAEVMLNATFRPLLTEVVNPYDISAIDPSTGSSYYKQYNKSVDKLIETISAPAGLKAEFNSGASFTFRNIQTDTIDVHFIGKTPGKTKTTSTTASITTGLKSATGETLNDRLSINVSSQADPVIQDYKELRRQYTKIEKDLDIQIRSAYEELLNQKSEAGRNLQSKKLYDLQQAKANVRAQLGEAFDSMNLTTTGIGTSRKRDIAKALQGVLDYTPINPFKWGIISGGSLRNTSGTIMVGQLFSFDETARLAEAAVTGDGGLNQLFRQAQVSKLAELKSNVVKGPNGELLTDADGEFITQAQVNQYIRTHNLTDTVNAGMKTFDNLNKSIFKSVKDFIFQDKDSKEAIITRASRSLRVAEQKTVDKKGFWQKAKSGWLGDYSEIDKSAMSVDKNYLKVNKRGRHILEAIADYDEQLTRTNGIGIAELERSLDSTGVRKLMRMEGERNIQGSINKILQGKGSNLALEQVMNNRAKGLIAGLVFISVAGNSIFQSTGGASLIAQAAFAVAGEKADIAVEFEGNRFLPTEYFHSALEGTFGAAPSLLAINTAAEVGFIAGSLYAGYKIAQYHSHYETIQYSYGIKELSNMSSEEGIRLVKRTSDLKARTATYSPIDLDDVDKALSEIAMDSANKGKLYVEILQEGRNPSKYVALDFNAGTKVFTTGKILQNVVKDLPLNTVIYASVGMLAMSGLREVAANTLQLMAKTQGDPDNFVKDIGMGLAAIGTVFTASYFAGAYFRKELYEDVLQMGDAYISNLTDIDKAQQGLLRIEGQLDYLTTTQEEALNSKSPILKDSPKAKAIEARKQRIKSVTAQQSHYKYLLDKDKAFKNFLTTEDGKRYARLVDLDVVAKGRYKAFNQTATMSSKLANFIGKNQQVIPIATAAFTTAALMATLYTKREDTEIDYSGSFDPLLAGAIGAGVGSLLTGSPALGLAVGVAAASAAYVVNWAGISFLKVGKAGKTADADSLKMTAQLAEFTKGVTSSLDRVNTFTITTSAYVSQFSNLGDKSIYGRSENPFDKTRVIAKQVPLPMLQFFVAEKVSGDYGTGEVGLDNTTTQRTYSVGVQSGALFGMSMALQLPVMYTPGRGFMGFSYNPEHNIDKLPNAVATIAAYSNIYMGTLATVGAVGSLLPGGVGRSFKEFSTAFGDFNKGVQNLSRNVNGFYIEQVSRTFVKLNLIDSQLLIQSVSDRVYEDYKLSSVVEDMTNTIDKKLAEHFGEGGAKGLVVDGKTLSGDELRLSNLNNLFREGKLDPSNPNHRQVLQIITEEKRGFYTLPENRKIGRLERHLVDKKMGVFGVDDISSFRSMDKSSSTLSYVGKLARFTRRNAFGATKFFIAGTMAANLIGTAIFNRAGEVDNIEEAIRKKDDWENKKNYWMLTGGFAAAASYTAFSEANVLAKKAITKFASNNSLVKTIGKSKNFLAQVGLAGAIFAYNYVRTSNEFGIAKFMDKHIAYKPEGGLQQGDQKGEIYTPGTERLQGLLYERNLAHKLLVTTGMTAYTLGAFYTTTGPRRSLSQLADVFYESYEGKTPTSVAGKVWERLNFGMHRRELAKLEVEGVLGDLSRLQFNDLGEFNSYYDLDGSSNPLLASRRKAETHLYELKDTIKKHLALERGGLNVSDIPDDYVHKYLGIHQKMKAKAAASGQSLLDLTQFMSPDEAEEYKAFMRAVKGGINEFGVNNPGKILQQTKFTRGLARKASATLILMATVRVGLNILNDVTTPENARAGQGGIIDSLFAKADAFGMVGQNRIDGRGKVGLLKGGAAVIADMARLITGHDRIDIGVIADQVNNRTQNIAVTRQSLYGSSRDLKDASALVQEFNAGFVLDDSNAYLALGSFGGVTFRQGDKGFRTSTYFQLQSAGQDISTASYSMAAKFYHKTIAGQGVELSYIIDASTRLLNDDKSIQNLEKTALLIRNATSMQTPLKNIRKVTKSKGSVEGDRLANLILNAREEAGRQLDRQSLGSIYTENYYTQVDQFQKVVGNDFFKKFMSRVAVGDELANNFLGEVLSGTFGYNPGNRNVVTGITFFQGGTGKMKKNQKGENIVVDELQGVSLSYQNAQYDQAQSKLLQYFDESFVGLIDQGLLNFLPDYIKDLGQKGLVIFAGFTLLSLAGGYAGSRQFMDDAQNATTAVTYKFTAHIDDGRAVNVSKEMVEKMNQARGQMGDTAYELTQGKVGTTAVQFNTQGGVGLEAYVKGEQAKDLADDLPPNYQKRSVNEILHQRATADTEWYGESLGRGNRAVITATDMENSVSYRFAISEAIQFAEEGTLDKITETLSKNKNYMNIDRNKIYQGYNEYLISQKQVLMDFDEFAKLKMFGEVDTFEEFINKVAGSTHKAELATATSQLNQAVRKRLTDTYHGMVEELFGGGFNEDGTIDVSRNRYTQMVEMRAPGDIPIHSHTVYEIMNGTFSDEEILSEMRTNDDIVKQMKEDVKLKGGDDVDNLLGNSRSLDDLGDANASHIERARKELVAKRLMGNENVPGVASIKQLISTKIDDELGKLGLQLEVQNGKTIIKANNIKGTPVVLKPGTKDFQEAMARITFVTEKVRMEVDTQGLLQSTARNLGVLTDETANQAGFVQRSINRMLGKGTQSSSRKAMRDVAQFRGMGSNAGGLSRALAGVPAAFEVLGTLSDVSSAINVYGAYVRLAESLSDPLQTQQDVDLAKKELGKVIIKSVGAVLLSVASTKIMGSIGWIWKKTNMNLTKLIVGTGVFGTLGALVGGAVYKGAIKPALQATKAMISENDVLDKAGKVWNKTWNVVSDVAGYTLGMPVEAAYKWGVQVFGEEGGKKAVFTTAGSLGAGMGMGMILAGLAFSSFVTLTAPVSLALIGTAMVAGAGLGLIFGDKNATVSTKLLNEIPKIPVIGWILGGMIDSPYRSIRSERRFKHFYQHSPFTVGYAADVVNQKWMATLSAAEDPTGADLVSNMFGEIIRPTEYESSAWRINSASYAPSPIPIVDGVIERELRIRAQTYGDLMLGRHNWENILKYSDQGSIVRAQIERNKQKEVRLLKEARRRTAKSVQGGGATSVPTHEGGSAAAPNNHAANMKVASEELKSATFEKVAEEAAKPTNTTFKVSMNVVDLNNAPQEQTINNLNMTVNRGTTVAQIPGIKYSRVIGEITENQEGAPIVSVRREVDYAYGVVRDASITTVMESEQPSPEQYAQGRVAVMAQNIHGEII